jgi:hypothetical protein
MRYLAIEKKIVTGLTMVLVSILATLSVAPGSASAGARFDLATLWLQGDSDAIGVQAYGDDGGEAAERALRVSVWHGREEDEHYQRGDELDVFFRTNQDVYAVVYRIDADGAVEVLWPTSRYDDGFAYGGHSYRLPPDGSRVPLRVANQKGVEYLQAIASEYPFDLRDLAIDFAFDPDQSERYDYEVAGDPFLAVNEINYAITGLDEDSEFVVTDWSHFYVEGKVDYARYSCRQCHTNDDDYHPYVDTCSQITIRHDFGWNNSWYDRYGYYPIYYDPLYTYWDLVSYRPYYNWYYPVCYTWPSYYSRPYYRPYRVYYWQDSNYFAGNYRTRYRRGGVGSRPLYDVTRPCPHHERARCDRNSARYQTQWRSTRRTAREYSRTHATRRPHGDQLGTSGCDAGSESAQCRYCEGHAPRSRGRCSYRAQLDSTRRAEPR